MRIALLSPFYPYRGGIAQFSDKLFETLEKEHEVKAFSFSRLYPSFLFPGKTQFVEEREKTAEKIAAQRILDSINPFSYEKTAKAIRQFQPDLLVIAYWTPFIGPAYGHVANRLKKDFKIVPLLHNALPHEPKFFDIPLARLLFDHSSGFMVMSETVKNDLLKIRPDAKVCLACHPVYDQFGEKKEKREAAEHLGLDPDKKTVLFFGLIRDYKGLDLLIQAFEKSDKHCQLVIAGESYGNFDRYKKLIDSSGAKERIHVFNRYIGNEEVKYFFSAADLLVLPYKTATQSGVIPLSYHFDLPVLATAVGDIGQEIGQQGTGLVCEASVDSLANGIKTFFHTAPDDFLKNIRKEKALLSWDHFADTLVRFAKDLP